MADRYVLDASAGVEILNRTSTGTTLAQKTFKRGAEEWTVEHFHLEVAKVIRRDVLRGQVTDQHATSLVDGLVQWPLNMVRVAPLLHDAWTMRHNITIHDALYVALARHLNATLLTGDARLANAPGLNVKVEQGWSRSPLPTLTPLLCPTDCAGPRVAGWQTGPMRQAWSGTDRRCVPSGTSHAVVRLICRRTLARRAAPAESPLTRAGGAPSVDTYASNQHCLAVV